MIHQEIFLTQELEPRCSTLRTDSLLSKPPGKPTFHVSLWGGDKNPAKYTTFDLSLFFPFPLRPKQGIVIYLNGEFGKENQTCSPQFFLSSFSCQPGWEMGGDTLTLAGQTLLHIEFLQDGVVLTQVMLASSVAVYPNHDFKKIICIDNKKMVF